MKPIKATSREKVMAEDCLRMAAGVAGGEAELRRRPFTFWSRSWCRGATGFRWWEDILAAVRRGK